MAGLQVVREGVDAEAPGVVSSRERPGLEVGKQEEGGEGVWGGEGEADKLPLGLLSVRCLLDADGETSGRQMGMWV